MGQRIAHLFSSAREAVEVDGPPTVCITDPANGSSKRKRPRANESGVGTAATTNGCTPFLGLALSNGVVRAVVSGPSVESTYGAPHHLYRTSDIERSHGIALGWDMRDQDLSASALLRLARVSNSCSKSMVVIVPHQPTSLGANASPPHECVNAMELQYAPSL